MDKQEVVDAFHRLYYESPERTWQNTHWLGVPLAKCPLDLWIYQEILTGANIETIIETGTWMGGSALYLASICDLLQRGRIFTIDISQEEVPPHPRISYLHGSSTDPDLVGYIRGRLHGGVLVILDSDHKKDHVLRELEIYSEMVTMGSYVIVEDTNVDGHPVFEDHGPGPWEAVTEFLSHPEKNFIPDESLEKFYMSFNPRGYLKRIVAGQKSPAKGL